MAGLAVAIFVVTYALIATERIHRVAAALGGAAALVVVGIVDAETAFFSPATRASTGTSSSCSSA